MALRIVKTGTWLYDGSVQTPVDIIALDYDWWYSLTEADGLLDPDEQPEAMGPDGCLYYVRFRKALQLAESTWIDSPGHATLAEAMRYAESIIVGGITWHDTMAI